MLLHPDSRVRKQTFLIQEKLSTGSWDRFLGPVFGTGSLNLMLVLQDFAKILKTNVRSLYLNSFFRVFVSILLKTVHIKTVFFIQKQIFCVKVESFADL